MDPEANQGKAASSSETVAERPGDEVSSASGSTRKRSARTRPKAGTHPNNVRKLRQSAMMSKAELARRAGVSPLTIDRVEAGCPCRMDTKRKILEALGLQPSAAKQVFPDVDLG
jgi:DNA-binding XRE family transcriptional regulator